MGLTGLCFVLLSGGIASRACYFYCAWQQGSFSKVLLATLISLQGYFFNCDSADIFMVLYGKKKTAALP